MGVPHFQAGDRGQRATVPNQTGVFLAKAQSCPGSHVTPPGHCQLKGRLLPHVTAATEADAYPVPSRPPTSAS